MEKLIIEPTVNSPSIVLDPEARTLNFRVNHGRKMYVSFICLSWSGWKSYTTEQENLQDDERTFGLQCQFNFEYFNSTSAKYILDIFKSLNAINAIGIGLEIKWLYEEDDEDMLEVGQEMSRMSKLSFEYIKSDD